MGLGIGAPSGAVVETASIDFTSHSITEAPASIEYRGTVIPLWSKPDLGAIRHEIDLAHQLIDGLIGEV